MDITDIVRQIKYNCDVSDAKYWGYFSLCGLLLRLRELYKSEHNLSPWSKVNPQDIGEWIKVKESLWADLESNALKDLHIDGVAFKPFDASEINSCLMKDNLIYGAGLGLYKKPIFFLGELYSYNIIDDYQVYFIKTEYVRDLFNSSGMLQGKEIFIRLQHLRSILWEMFLELRCRENSLFEDVFSSVSISPQDETDMEFEAKIETLTMRYSEIILYHELAEAYESSDEWTNIILHIEDRKAEYFLRGLKDMLANTSEYGPLQKIIDAEDKGALCFYISLIEMFHKAVYPELKSAFNSFMIEGDWKTLADARQKVYSKSSTLKEKIHEAYHQSNNEDDFLAIIRGLFYQN